MNRVTATMAVSERILRRMPDLLPRWCPMTSDSMPGLLGGSTQAEDQGEQGLQFSIKRSSDLRVAGPVRMWVPEEFGRAEPGPEARSRDVERERSSSRHADSVS